jgi:hypothetical protein
MLTGQRFKLRKSALAIEIVNGMRLQVNIPSRTILKVIASPIHDHQMVDVLWEDKRVSMFAVDLITRGTEIPGRKADPKINTERLPEIRAVMEPKRVNSPTAVTRISKFTVAIQHLATDSCNLGFCKVTQRRGCTEALRNLRQPGEHRKFGWGHASTNKNSASLNNQERPIAVSSHPISFGQRARNRAK